MSASRPLRVLMVDSERTWRGGQAQVHLLMRGLVDAGHEVALAAPGNGVLFSRAADLRVRCIPCPLRSGFDSVLPLRALMRGNSFDIVHSHASRAHSAVAMARMGTRNAPPHVVSRRVDFPVGAGAWGRWKYRRSVDAYIALSDNVRDVLIRGGVDPATVTVATSGIDLAKFARVRDPSYLRREFNLGESDRVIVNVAALAPHKAQSILLRALPPLVARGGTRCFIVGEGALREPLERLARELGIEGGVTFTGFRHDALEFIRVADVFVMSSHLEGLGTSIMDAHALGTAVVATRTGGIPELVEDGVTGALVPPGSPELLGDALARMLDDAALRERCVRAGKAQSERYDYRRTVYKTLDVYRRLCHVDTPLEGNSAR